MSTLVSEQDVLSALAALSLIWPNREMSPEACRLYWVAVRHLTREQFVKAMETAVKTCKYFPAPAEILEFAPTVSETQPWTVPTQDIRRALPAPPLHPTIKEMIADFANNHRMPRPRAKDWDRQHHNEWEPQPLLSDPEEASKQEARRHANLEMFMWTAHEKGEITHEQYRQFQIDGSVPQVEPSDGFGSGGTS